MSEIIIDIKDKILTNGIIQKMNKILNNYKFTENIEEMDINIDDLYVDNWREIISYLSIIDIYNIRKVNKVIHLAIKACIKDGIHKDDCIIYLDKVISDKKKWYDKLDDTALLYLRIDKSYGKLLYTYSHIYNNCTEVNKIYLISTCNDIKLFNDEEYHNNIKFMIDGYFNNEVYYEADMICSCNDRICCQELLGRNAIYPTQFDPREILGLKKKSKELLYYESVTGAKYIHKGDFTDTISRTVDFVYYGIFE